MYVCGESFEVIWYMNELTVVGTFPAAGSSWEGSTEDCSLHWDSNRTVHYSPCLEEVPADNLPFHGEEGAKVMACILVACLHREDTQPLAGPLWTV
jgi:hypothetical protein